MTSLQSHIVQIPRNSHFRPVPSLAPAATPVHSSFFTFTPNAGVAPRLTSPANLGATGTFALNPVVSTFASSVQPALSSGTGLLKDLGETIVSAGRTFRRVQIVLPNNNDFEDQMGGSYAGDDYDALAGYIELGLRGIGAAGPFVRAM